MLDLLINVRVKYVSSAVNRVLLFVCQWTAPGPDIAATTNAFCHRFYSMPIRV
jgi:hypothetical protein